MADNSKKRIINDATLIDAGFLQPVFGGDKTADPNSPEYNGHFHDGRTDSWGHAPKIDLTNHTTGRLVLQDSFAVAKSVSASPSIVATPNSVLSGSFINIDGSSINSAAYFDNTLPLKRMDGYFNASLGSPYGITSISSPVYPITTSALTSAIWYFSIPFDMDITKPAYFSFGWMGDILTLDNAGNTVFDSNKLDSDGNINSQTTTFRITWQWYSAGYSVFPPAVVYDGYIPTNLAGTKVNANTLTRGRIPTLAVNQLPFTFTINDSSTGNQNYVGLTGLQQATSAVMVGIQVDVLNSGFVSSITSGHINFFQGNLIYLSKTMGSPLVSFKTI